MNGQTGIVILNESGKYLFYFEVSSHSTNTQYSYSWTSILDEASIFISISELKKVPWKANSPLDAIVGTLPAKSSRKVELTYEMKK